jgi:hypothetical protein
LQENIIISAVILWVGNTTKEMNALLKENIAACGSDMPILCFLHLPRTAGSTLNRLLKYTFGDRAIFHADLLAAYGGEAGLSATLAKDKALYQGMMILAGHYGVAHPLVRQAPRPLGIAAVLRQPVERIVSLYDYIRACPDHPEHAALSRLTLHQAMDAVPNFAAHCRNAQLQTLFGATDQRGIMAAFNRYPYLLGRMDALEAFAQRLLASFGLTLGGALPRFNERLCLPGVAPAQQQPDYASAVARLVQENRAELAFFAQLPAVFSSRPVKISAGAA